MMDNIDAALDAEMRRPHHHQRELRGACEKYRLRSSYRQ